MSRIKGFVEPVSLYIVFIFWILYLVIALVLGYVPVLFAVNTYFPSPGWLFSSVSHSNLTHILVNTAGMLILGNAAEKHLEKLTYITAFFSFSVVSNVLAWTHRAYISSPGSVLGASGAIYAFGSFYFVYTWREDIFELDDLPQGTLEVYKDLMTSRWLIWLTGMGVTIHGLGMSMPELTGLIELGGTSHVAHGVGVTLGILLALVRPSNK
jgi:membrane associated rhomboid family serine protease